MRVALVSYTSPMSTKKAVTLRLDPEEYRQLEAEARRLSMAPGTLARLYVRAGLSDGESEREQRRRAGLAALDRLVELTSGLPPVDAVRVASESREDLEQRAAC